MIPPPHKASSLADRIVGGAYRHRWWLLVAGTCIAAFAVGYAKQDAELGLFMVIFGAPLGLLLAAYVAAQYRLRAGMGASVPTTGPDAHLLGREAIVLGARDGWLWVRVDGRDWPARLPPFISAPPAGHTVRIENVADDILVVRPGSPPPT